MNRTQIVHELRQRAAHKPRFTTLDINDLRYLRRTVKDPEERRQILLDYYSNTPEGQEEWRNSIHFQMGKRLEAVVDDLCKEIDSWEDDGYPKSYSRQVMKDVNERSSRDPEEVEEGPDLLRKERPGDQYALGEAGGDSAQHP